MAFLWTLWVAYWSPFRKLRSVVMTVCYSDSPQGSPEGRRVGLLNHFVPSKERSVKKAVIATVVSIGVGSAGGSPGQSCCTWPVTLPLLQGSVAPAARMEVPWVGTQIKSQTFSHLLTEKLWRMYWECRIKKKPPPPQTKLYYYKRNRQNNI